MALSLFNADAILRSSVLTPISISMIGMSVFSECDTLESEHTPTYDCSMVQCSDQYRIAWRISDMDGTAYSISPPAPTMRSAIRSDVRVLPVPHAMMSCPRSDCFRPATTFLRAAFWWSHSLCGFLRLTLVGPAAKLGQSTLQLARDSKFTTSHSCPASASSAFLPYPLPE